MKKVILVFAIIGVIILSAVIGWLLIKYAIGVAAFLVFALGCVVGFGAARLFPLKPKKDITNNQ